MTSSNKIWPNLKKGESPTHCWADIHGQGTNMNEFEKHVSRAFDNELTTLRSHVLEMGGLVESQCLAATQAYTSGEVSTVADIVETDRKIDIFQTLIEDECA